jgi:hypothetical protein
MHERTSPKTASKQFEYSVALHHFGFASLFGLCSQRLLEFGNHGPVTILSTISTCMAITKVTVSGLQIMCELKTKYDNMDLGVNAIVSKLLSIDFSLSLL